MDGDNRITAIDKRTGRVVPLFPSAQPLFEPGQRSPWESVRCAYERCAPSKVPERILTEHLIMMKIGEEAAFAEWRSGGRLHQHTFGHEELAVSPMGEAGERALHDPANVITLAIDNRLILDIAFDAGIPENFDIVERIPVKDGFLSGSLNALLQEMESGYPGGRLYGESIAAAVAAHLLNKYSSIDRELREPAGGLNSATLRLVTEYIKSHYDHEVSLSELASLAYMSPYHFSRLFKKSTGLTPHQYLIHYRITRSIELLMLGRHTIKEIARHVGFSDHSHLSRLFKKIVGVSPSTYLNRKINPPSEQ